MRLGFVATAGRFVDLGFAATVLLALVALAMLCTRQPARRLRIARLGLLGALSLPILDQIDYVPRINLGPQAAEALRFVFEWVAPSWGSWWSRALEYLRGLESARFAFWMMAGYLLIVTIGLGRLVLGWLGTRRLLADTTEPSVELFELYESLPTSVEKPDLRVSPRAGRPVLIGIFQPTIVVPTSLEDPGLAGHSLAVLTHELAHAEASDPLFGLLIEILQVVAFPVLPLWWIKRQTKLDQELVADAQAASAVGDRAAYASSLLAFASDPGSLRKSDESVVATAGRDGSDLYRRVLVLLRSKFALELRPSILWLGGCTIILFAATLVTAMINARPSFNAKGRVPDVPVSDTMNIGTLGLKAASTSAIPLPVPDEFVFEGLVDCDDEALARIKVGGLPMRRPEARPSEASRVVSRHRFEFVRDARSIRLSVDGKLTGIADRPGRSGRLTIESQNDQPVTFSSAVIRWGHRPPH